jgi:hypothetical protein
VFENRVLRRIFGPEMDEVTGEWRRLYAGELHNLYSSPGIIRQIKSGRKRWAGHVAHMVEERKVYKVLVGKPKGKRLLRRPRHRWEGVEWIHLAQDRDQWWAFMNTVMNLWVLVPQS